MIVNHSGSTFTIYDEIILCLEDEGQEMLSCLKMKLTFQGMVYHHAEMSRSWFDKHGTNCCLLSMKPYIENHLKRSGANSY